MQCKQAHEYAHIKCKQPSSWACSPYLCAFLVQEFLILSHSSSLPLCPCPCPNPTSHNIFVLISPKLYFFELYFFVLISPKAFISLYNLSPFVIDFHKRCASYWCKALHWGRWLRLESCIFMDTTKNWNDITCIALKIPHIGSLTLIPIGGTPPPKSLHGSSIW